MVYKNILVSLCGRGDESIVINEAINIADGGQLSFVHVNDLHSWLAGEMFLNQSRIHFPIRWDM